MSGSILTFILLVLIPIRVESIIGYKCDLNSPAVKELSLVDIPACLPIKRNITIKTSYIQLLQPKSFDEVKYYQCLIEIKHLIYRCGKTFETFHKNAMQTELLQLTRTECNDLQKTGVFKYEGLTIKINPSVNINYVSTQTFGKIIDSTCYPGEGDLIINGNIYDRAVRISEFKVFIKKGRATIDLDEKKIIFEDGMKCIYHDLTCFSFNSGNIYWDSIFDDAGCSRKNEKNYLVIYEGESKEIVEVYKEKTIISYIVYFNNYDFQITTTGKITQICNQKALQTEHPNLVIIKKEELDFFLKFEPEKLTKNINLMTYLNSKLLYIHKHTKEQIDDLYSKITYDRCMAENKITHNMLTLAILSPTQFAFEYMGSSGFTAITRGEILYLIKCTPLSVNLTTTNVDVCYNEIPVIYNGNNLFLHPRTRILSSIGTQVDCSSLLTIKYKINDNWYILTNRGLIISTRPELLNIEHSEDWEFKEINNLAEVGIYSLKELDAMQKIIMTPIQVEPLTLNIQRTLEGKGVLPPGSSVVNLFSESDFKKMINQTTSNIWKEFFEKFQAFGNFFSSIIGLFALIKLIKFFLNMIINSIIIYKELGFTWKLLLSWWENLVHHFLRTNKKNKEQEDEKDYRMSNDDQMHHKSTRLDSFHLESNRDYRREYPLLGK